MSGVIRIFNDEGTAMTDLTGDALRPAAFTTTRREVQERTAAAPAGSPALRTGDDLRAALAALPMGSLRRGYRPEAVERLLEKAAEELDRRSRGEAPYLRAEHVHPDGFAMARPGYAVGPARTLLAQAAEALKH